MPNVSVTIVTRNEALRIADALTSVAWADDVVVVDAESTDETVAIARQFTGRVYTRPWPGFVDQKNHAAGLARHDWILSIDADERVTPALAAEIRELGEPAAQGYRVPRVSRYLGRWLRATDWYPDYQVRLYDRRAAAWQGRYVHESVTVNGQVATLRSELQHLPYRDLAHHLQTIDRYTTLAARQMFESGRRTSALGIAIRPPLAFVRNYVLRRGFTAGAAGLIVSLLNSYYVLAKFAKLWELQQAGAGQREPAGEQAGDPSPAAPPVRRSVPQD